MSQVKVSIEGIIALALTLFVALVILMIMIKQLLPLILLGVVVWLVYRHFNPKSKDKCHGHNSSHRNH